MSPRSARVPLRIDPRELSRLTQDRPACVAPRSRESGGGGDCPGRSLRPELVAIRYRESWVAAPEGLKCADASTSASQRHSKLP